MFFWLTLLAGIVFVLANQPWRGKHKAPYEETRDHRHYRGWR